MSRAVLFDAEARRLLHGHRHFGHHDLVRLVRRQVDAVEAARGRHARNEHQQVYCKSCGAGACCANARTRYGSAAGTGACPTPRCRTGAARRFLCTPASPTAQGSARRVSNRARCWRRPRAAVCAPQRSLKPVAGTREVPVTNWRKRQRCSGVNSRTICPSHPRAAEGAFMASTTLGPARAQRS